MKLDISKYDMLDKETVIEFLSLLENYDCIDEVLLLLNDIAKSNYNEGYEIGYDRGYSLRH